MPFTWSSGAYSFEYTEHVASVSPGDINIADDDSRATRVLLFDYDSRVSATRATLGYAFQGGPSSAPFISRAIPMPYNDFYSLFPDFEYPGPSDPEEQPYLWATKANIKGLGVPESRDMVGADYFDGQYPGTNNAVYNQAIMTVVYESVPWTVMTDEQMVGLGYSFGGNPDEASLARYVTVEPAQAAQYLNVPAGCMFIAGTVKDAVIQGIAPGKIIGQPDIVITWRRVPGYLVPSAFVNPSLGGITNAIENSIGKTNLDGFPPSGPFANTYDAGTLLLTAVRLRRIRSAVGGTIWDIEYHMQFQQSFQNYVPYISSAGLFTYVELSSDGMAYGPVTATNGKHIYDSIDFAPLFRAAF